MTYSSEFHAICYRYVNGELSRLPTLVGSCKFIKRCVMRCIEPEIRVHGLTVICEVVDLICGRRDDTEVETCSSHAPPKVGVTGC